jgi:hypothetical protein
MEMTGTQLMQKITVAAALVFSLIAAPMPQLVSTAAAQQQQQQASTPDKNAKPKREQSPGQIAARERQKKCAAEWKEEKAAGKVDKGTTWPKYWSACNKRLKAAAK